MAVGDGPEGMAFSPDGRDCTDQRHPERPAQSERAAGFDGGDPVEAI